MCTVCVPIENVLLEVVSKKFERYQSSEEGASTDYYLNDSITAHTSFEPLEGNSQITAS